MKIILTFIIYLLAGTATAQAISSISLSCEGEYRDLRGKVDTQLKNVIVKISDDNIIISGIPGLANLEEKYKTTIKKDHLLCVAHAINPNFNGCINRFTGSFTLMESDFEKSRWHQSFDGACRVTQKLF